MTPGNRVAFIACSVMLTLFGVLAVIAAHSYGQRLAHQNRAHDVSYYVTGSAKFASVTYANGSGGTEQIDMVVIPWHTQSGRLLGRSSILLHRTRGSTGA